MNLLEISTADELRSFADPWDELWRRSDVTHPAARADLLALWLDHFALDREFRAYVVEDQGRFLAALPLSVTSFGGFERAAVLPANAWSPGGELLVDQTLDATRALQTLIARVAKADFSLLWLDGVRLGSDALQQFVSALENAEFALDTQHRFDVGLLSVNSDWESYLNTLSRSHRQSFRKHWRRLNEQGTLTFRIVSDAEPEQVSDMLRSGFAVEHNSWKGRAGSSVLATPGMFEFFRAQAEQAARWGQLDLAFLELDGRPIAFEYGWTAKGVHHAFKIGYDSGLGKFGPGRLLMGKLIERFCGDASRRLVDCLGPMSGAIDRWRPDQEPVSRVIAARPGWRGWTLLQGYRAARTCVRQARQWNSWLQDKLPEMSAPPSDAPPT